MNSPFPLARLVARMDPSVIGDDLLDPHVPALGAPCMVQRDAQPAAPARGLHASQENLQ